MAQQPAYSGKSLDELPDELLLYIVSAVARTKDLCSLCSISRRFYAITIPFLYQKLRDKKPCVSFDRYLGTILQRADLALLVKSLGLGHWQDGYFRGPTWMGPHKDSTLFEDAMQDVNTGEHKLSDCLRNRTDSDLMDAKLALLLSRTPNLEELFLHLAPQYGDIPLSLQLLHDAGLSLHPSQNQFRVLRRISLTHKTNYYDNNLWENISALLTLPSLRVFEIAGFYDESKSESEGVWSCPPNQSQIEHIRLNTDNGLEIWTLDRLLESPKTLKSFTWEGKDVSRLGLNVELPFEELGGALRRQRHSLESLTVTDPDRCPFDTSNLPSIQSLVDYPHLKSIHLPIAALREVTDDVDPMTGTSAVDGCLPFYDRLPPHLETLKLNDLRCFKIDKELDDFEQIRSLRFPILRKVEYDA